MARDSYHDGNSVEKLIGVNRVTKVVKGGRIMAFSALAVVGNGDGSVGMGKGRSKEVPIAVQKAMDKAKKNQIHVPLKKGTLYHEIKGKHGATTVFMRPAPQGTGIIAGGPMRAICEAVGIKNVSAKCYGSTNQYNIVRATLDAFSKINTPSSIASKRGKSIAELFGHEVEEEANV